MLIPEEKIHELLSKAIYVPIVSRICVSTRDINKIVEEVNKKYRDGLDLYEFFESRFLYTDDTYKWHLSPFGLIYVEYEPEKRFKATGIVSLRHILEEMRDEGKTAKEIRNTLKILLKNANIERANYFKEYKIPNKVYSIADKELKNQKIYFQKFDPGYLIAWEGASRAATHQLVRHQSFDYQQQSQRYINYAKKNAQLTGFYIPSYILNDKNKYETYIQKQIESFENYKQALKEGYKPEDARFYLTNAFTSRIIFFAPKERKYGRDGLLDFVKKRSIPHAQEEIRNFAEKIGEILLENFDTT